jgi:hypothetical protein
MDSPAGRVTCRVVYLIMASSRYSVGKMGRCHAKYSAEYSAIMSTAITITAYLTASLWLIMPSSPLHDY